MPFTGELRGIPVFRPETTDFNLNNSVLAPYVFAMSPGYLEAAATRLLGGRDVSWHDTTETPDVAVVNGTFARKMWGETPAIGQRFILWGHSTEELGVAEDGKRPAGVATAGGLSAVVAKGAERSDFRNAVAAGVERDGTGARTPLERPRAECANHRAELPVTGADCVQANPRDPVVVIGAVLTMALLGLAASAIPALRALTVDPSKLMREE